MSQMRNYQSAYCQITDSIDEVLRRKHHTRLPTQSHYTDTQSHYTDTQSHYTYIQSHYTYTQSNYTDTKSTSQVSLICPLSADCQARQQEVQLWVLGLTWPSSL